MFILDKLKGNFVHTKVLQAAFSSMQLNLLKNQKVSSLGEEKKRINIFNRS